MMKKKMTIGTTVSVILLALLGALAVSGYLSLGAESSGLIHGELRWLSLGIAIATLVFIVCKDEVTDIILTQDNTGWLLVIIATFVGVIGFFWPAIRVIFDGLKWMNLVYLVIAVVLAILGYWLVRFIKSKKRGEK